jgi:hypothetical protein
VAPITAAVVAYIAYQQWRLNKHREERESRAARLSVYRRVRAMLMHVEFTGVVRDDDYIEFCEAVAEADFLFPESVRDWLAKVWAAANQWVDLNNMVSSAAPNADINSLNMSLREMDEFIEQLRAAHKSLRQQFAEHMK